MTAPQSALASTLLVLLLGSSCKPEPDRTEAEPAEAEPVAPQPATPEPVEPKPEAPDVPRVYDDGALSVRGLREDFDAQISNYDAQVKAGAQDIPDKEILVRAWVVSLYEPPVGCIRCRQAHAWLADGPDVTDRSLGLLVGPIAFEMSEEQAAIWADQPKVALEIGKQYLFKGSFERMTDTGLTDPRGVLQFIAVQNQAGDWIAPPMAPWHPKQIELNAAEDAKLLEAMKQK